MADPAKTGGRMLQSEQATEGDRARQQRGIELQGQMALSAAAQFSEQMRKQQELTMRAQEGKQRSAMLAVKQQLFQQQVGNAGMLLQLKQQQAQSQMMQAESSRMRAELEASHQQTARYKITGPVKVNDKWIGLQDPRSGTYGEISEEEATRQSQMMREERVGKDRGPSITKLVNELMDRSKLGSRAAETPLEALGRIAQQNGIDNNTIGEHAAKIGSGQYSREQAIIDLLLKLGYTR